MDLVDLERENEQYLEDESACSSSLSCYLDQDEELLNIASNSEKPFDMRSLSISPIPPLETDSFLSPACSPKHCSDDKNPISNSLEHTKSNEFHYLLNSINLNNHYNKSDNNKVHKYEYYINIDENNCYDIVSLDDIHAQIAPLNGSLLETEGKNNSNLETIFEDVYLDTPPKCKKKLTWTSNKKLRKN